jgi:topoisomerase-4 subunit A
MSDLEANNIDSQNPIEEEEKDGYYDDSGNFSAILSEKYLAYALSTITSRSLPDVRDGLKPVHRRLLWAMHQLKLDPKSGYKKCARVVGDVIGKYHPHGDSAVYDAMVRLAQNFSMRYPLVEGQGNFGSIDGDNAAAMRYTEARMTSVATEMLRDIQNNTVNFRPTYDSLDEEPVVLPAYFPNLLANGSEGIAVGMATAIPPHNAEELCDALLKLIKKPNSSIEEICEFVEGPDFPTGGIIIETKQDIIKAYEAGKGSFRLRAKWESEDLGRGSYQIVITEIPYQVQKSRLLEKLAESLDAKKLPLLGNIKDESDENIRIILEPKNRNVDPEILMESIFKASDLEIRYNMNLNVLDSRNMPGVKNLKEILVAFLDHQKDVLLRKSNYRLDKINHRLEILAGLLVAYLNIDEVIKIIREEDKPAEIMMERFNLTKIQVEAILNMRLRSLRKLEEFEIRKENDELLEEKAYLEKLVSDEKEQKKVISKNIKNIKKLFGKETDLGARKTEIINKELENKVISIEAFIEKEPITVCVSKLGWARAFKGHNIDPESVKYKDGDKEAFLFKAHTTDKIVIFSTGGRAYNLQADKIPGGKGFGDPIRLLIEIPADEDIIEIFNHEKGKKYIVASKSGKGFIVGSEDLTAQTKGGRQVLNVKKGDSALTIKELNGTHIATLGENRRMLIFSIEELPEMKRGQGVLFQKYKEGGLSDFKTFDYEEGLTWHAGSRQSKMEKDDMLLWTGKRASRGRTVPRGFPRNNKFDE